MVSIRYNFRDVELYMCIVVCCIMSCVLALVDNGDDFGDILIGVLWFLIITTLVAKQLMTTNASIPIKQLVFGGYTVRIIMAILQTYFPSLLPPFMTGFDQKSFFVLSTEYYHGEFSGYRTNFPILLYRLFYITGTGELPIRLLFIYLWFLGFLLIQKMTRGLKGNRHWFLILFYSLLPWTLFISTAILRESIMMYSLMLALFYLRQWMQDGKKFNIMRSLFFSVPALWLHSGNVAILFVVFMTIMLWDTKKQKWDLTGLNWKKLIIVLAIISFPMIYNGFVMLFPGKFTGPFSVDYLISRIPYTEARTSYVSPESQPTNIQELIQWTPYRMFYFWMSPTPGRWSSVGDAIMFMTDTIPWILFFVYMFKGIRRKHLSEEAKISILILISFTFIYAWGTLNAGTALRHRDHLLGIFVMTALMEKENKRTIEKKFR